MIAPVAPSAFLFHFSSVLTSPFRDNLRRRLKEKKHYSNSSLKFHSYQPLIISLLTNFSTSRVSFFLYSPDHLYEMIFVLCFPDAIGSETICSFLMTQSQPLLYEKLVWTSWAQVAPWEKEHEIKLSTSFALPKKKEESTTTLCGVPKSFPSRVSHFLWPCKLICLLYCCYLTWSVIGLCWHLSMRYWDLGYSEAHRLPFISLLLKTFMPKNFTHYFFFNLKKLITSCLSLLRTKLLYAFRYSQGATHH